MTKMCLQPILIFFLQTRCLPESHTGTNIAHVLKEAVDEWHINPTNPPIVSDNASNMSVAAKEFGTELHVGCFAHTLNLACGKALKLPAVSRLLARLRRIVSFFHRSTTATAILKDKQTLMNVPEHRLIMDVSTRWNSALAMISRFLEQQSAVYAALTSKELRGKEKDVSTLSESDITAAEELTVVLNPLQVATTALCEEAVPTLSMIVPLQYQLITHTMKQTDDDSQLIKDVKKAIRDDLSPRYQRIRKELVLASLLDPRFKAAPFLTEQEKMDAYYDLTLRAISVLQAPTDLSAEASVPPLTVLPNEPVTVNDTSPSPSKKIKIEEVSEDTPRPKTTAMSSLFGDVYITKVEAPKSPQEITDSEVSSYKREPAIATNLCPLTWWSKNCDRYPTLALIARQFLCVPATSVPSERVFSTAGDIVTSQRAALKPEHVDQLIFLKKNWKP